MSGKKRKLKVGKKLRKLIKEKKKYSGQETKFGGKPKRPPKSND